MERKFLASRAVAWRVGSLLSPHIANCIFAQQDLLRVLRADCNPRCSQWGGCSVGGLIGWMVGLSVGQLAGWSVDECCPCVWRAGFVVGRSLGQGGGRGRDGAGRGMEGMGWGAVGSVSLPPPCPFPRPSSRCSPSPVPSFPPPSLRSRRCRFSHAVLSVQPPAHMLTLDLLLQFCDRDGYNITVLCVAVAAADRMR